MSRITRRALLIGAGSVVIVGGAAAAAGVEAGILPGRSTLHRVLGLDGPAGEVPDVSTGPLVSGSFSSEKRGGIDTGWSISYPPGFDDGDSLPVLIVLHGAHDNHADAFGSRLGLDRFLAAAVDDGVAPFAIAAVDGGDTYWHARESGEDSGAMVTDEFIPLLAQNGLDTSRIALLGWSMGGYGALLIGGRLGPRRVASIVASSPALWPRAADAAAIAYDSPDDYSASTVYGRQRELRDIPVRIDCGSGDGFAHNVEAYITTLDPAPEGGITAGGHDMAYWRRVAPEQLVFVGEHFA